MRRLLLDHPKAGRQGKRLPRYAAVERRQGERLSPLFENVFRRARTRDTQAKLTKYLTIERYS